MVPTYKSRIRHIQEELNTIQKRMRLFSWLRLLVFLLIIPAVYYYFTLGYPFGLLIMTLALTAIFLIIVRIHADIKYDFTVHNNLLKINQNEINILQQKASFLDDGAMYHKSFSYTEDLDIFGPLSIFHMINRCFSEPGRKKLARWLTSPAYDQNTIWKRQRANISVKDEVEVRQSFLAHGLAHFQDSEKTFNVQEQLIPPSTLQKFKILRWILPLITAAAIITTLITHESNWILYGFLLNLILTGFYLKSTLSLLQQAEQTFKHLKNYQRPIQIIIQSDYTRDSLKEKKSKLKTIFKHLKSLQNRYNLLESRSNIFAGLILNGFLGFDFWAVTHLHNWYDDHATQIPMWLDEIAYFEALFSISTFAYNNPSYTLPGIENQSGISGRNIRHPFIREEENIGNPLQFTPPLKVILLTGSNMAGKSTFLRSLGVNQILAMTGSVVAADEFNTGLYAIYTSFRKSDSIHEHTSLFYDELKKLKYIISELKNINIPSIILLDEILRGTNSDDKFYGSRQILLRLKDTNSITMLATHDIALATLEEEHPQTIHNYCFESQIQNGELHFDYKLKKGVATNRNATFLMEKMGII